MGGVGERGRADAEPRGFVPRGWATGPPLWRRLVDWVFGDRDDIDQQGLLVERTLLPPASRDAARPSGAPPGGPEGVADRARRLR